MKEIYIIMSLDEAGRTNVMRSAYSTQEYAIEALECYRTEAAKRGDKKTIYYYSVMNLVK